MPLRANVQFRTPWCVCLCVCVSVCELGVCVGGGGHACVVGVVICWCLLHWPLLAHVLALGTGSANVSNSFAATLWSIDVLLNLASVGARRWNFHGEQSAQYSAVVRSPAPRHPLVG
jgi:hypothetical protein